MQKWEYLVVYIQAQETTPAAVQMGMETHLNADKFTERLNHYASAGWELMHFEWDGNQGAKAVFKRPRG